MICNRSVGLVQRAIEEGGIPTVGISISRKYTEQVRAPRSVFLKWPMGHPLGEPFKPAQQTTVLRDALSTLDLATFDERPCIVDLPYRWKRHVY